MWIESQFDGAGELGLRGVAIAQTLGLFFVNSSDVAARDGDFGTFWAFEVFVSLAGAACKQVTSDPGHWVAVCIAPRLCQHTDIIHRLCRGERDVIVSKPDLRFKSDEI